MVRQTFLIFFKNGESILKCNFIKLFFEQEGFLSCLKAELSPHLKKVSMINLNLILDG